MNRKGAAQNKAVTPTKVGVQQTWIPAYAGMTLEGLFKELNRKCYCMTSLKRSPNKRDDA